MANDLDVVAAKPTRAKAEIKSIHERLKQKVRELEHQRQGVRKAVRMLMDNL